MLNKLLQKLSVAAPLVVILVIALAVLLPANPAWMQGVYRDSGVFLYVGWRILKGETPYLDVWDHKPPGIFYLNALGLALTGNSRWGVWIIEVLLLGLAAWLGWRLLRRAFGELPAFFASALWVITLISVLEAGNLTTEYTLPLQFACLGLFYVAEQRGRYGWRAFVIGVLGGIAFLFKPNTIGIWLAIGLYWAFGLRDRQRRGVILRDMAPLAGGAAAPLALTVLCLGLAGALPAFWDATVLYNAVYSRQPLFEHANAILKGIGYLNESGLFLLAALGWLAAGVKLRYANPGETQEMQPAGKALLYLALLDLPLELALVSVSGRGFRHYYMPLLPACAVLCALAYQFILAFFRQPAIPRWVLAVVTFGLLAVAGAAQSTAYYMVWKDNRSFYPAQLVSFIAEQTAPDDTVLVWGSQPGINFLAQRRSPTRYAYQFPLSMPGYTTSAMIEQFLDDMIASPPRLVVCAPGNDLSLDFFQLQTPQIEAGKQWLAAHYGNGQTIAGWMVYNYNP